MARAKAEAAKARLPYAKKEMALKVEKAQLEATMNMLSLEQETAAAVAEAEVLEAAIVSDRSSSKFYTDPLSATPLDPMERTKEYVAKQAKEENRVQFAPILHQLYEDENGQSRAEQASAHPVQTSHFKKERSQADADLCPATLDQTVIALQPQPTPDTRHYSSSMQDDSRTYGANHGPPLSSIPSHTPQHAHQNQANMTDFVRYLARRELVTTGLIQFNDQPYSYKAWKRS